MMLMYHHLNIVCRADQDIIPLAITDMTGPNCSGILPCDVLFVFRIGDAVLVMARGVPMRSGVGMLFVMWRGFARVMMHSRFMRLNMWVLPDIDGRCVALLRPIIKAITCVAPGDWRHSIHRVVSSGI